MLLLPLPLSLLSLPALLLASTLSTGCLLRCANFLLLLLLSLSSCCCCCYGNFLAGFRVAKTVLIDCPLNRLVVLYLYTAPLPVSLYLRFPDRLPATTPPSPLPPLRTPTHRQAGRRPGKADLMFTAPLSL